MAFFEFPHTRTYDSDLGWLIKSVKKIIDNLQTLNTSDAAHTDDIKKLYDQLDRIIDAIEKPIEAWDPTKYYLMYETVEYNGQYYTAIKDVPSGIGVTDTEYWIQSNGLMTVIAIMQDNIETLTKIADASIITPEKYGAVGDGITDDTAAINECLQANPNSTIVFRNGKYAVSDTLNIYGNQGGQTVILGGATLTWIGAADTSKAFIAINKVTDSESRAHIIGGTLMCNDLVGIGIFVNMFHSTLDTVKIFDPTNEAIRIGTSGNERSLQTVIRDCYMQISTNSAQGWSDENTLKGIAAYEPDGFVSNTNVNRFNTSVYLKSQGYEFVNCHFTASYKNRRTAAQGLAETKGVVIHPESEFVSNSNTFTNIYFDNHKYCFYGDIMNRVVCSIDNSKYFNMGHLVDGNFEAFMLGGYVTYLNVDNFTIVPSSSCIFYDASFCNNSNFQSLQMMKQDYKKTIYGLNTDIQEIAQHLMQPNQYANFLNKHKIDPAHAIRVGSIMFLSPAANLGYCPIITLKYRRQNIAAVDIHLQYYTSTGKFVILPTSNVIRGDVVGTPEFIIGEKENITINGLNCVRFPLFFRNASQTINSWIAYVALDYVSPIKFYANEDRRNIVEYTDIIDPFTISMNPTL